MTTQFLVLSSIGALIIACIAYYINNLRWNKKYKLPPLVEGGIPLFGNALQLPPTGHEAGVVTKQWAEKYGEMYPPIPIPIPPTPSLQHN